ncbi:MAG: nuclear transport factor 2 family protein [Actinomycetota bacterium]|nr:nuclear transport factor 2 family protein [Actinomycetota bacterium]
MAEAHDRSRDSVEERLERLERRAALYDLIASYGPAVDSGSAEWTASLWAEEGIYDFGDASLPGRAAVEAMVAGPNHQGLIHQGAAHMLGPPRVKIDGDRAVVVHHSQVVLQRDGKFEIWRVSANRWELRWVDGSWQVDRRRAYLLNGQERARALLRLDDEAGSAG